MTSNSLKEFVWQEMFKELKAFKEVHGHCKPAKKECIDEFEGLYQWCIHQRMHLKKKMAGNEEGGKLMNEAKEKNLREIGFDFSDQAGSIFLTKSDNYR